MNEISRKKSGLIALIEGIIVHLYMITNKLPLADDVAFSVSKSSGVGITSGRWFLEYYSLTDGWNVPMNRGITAIIFGSLAIAVMLELCSIHECLYVIVFSGVFWTFPYMASIFSQMYMADVYFLGVLFAEFGVWLFFKLQGFRKYILPSLCFAMSVGIYQSLIQYAIVSFLIVTIGMNFKSDKRIKELFCDGLKMCCSLCGGIILYEIILKIELKRRNVTLSDYQGIASMNEFSLSRLIAGCKRAYTNYFVFLTGKESGTFNDSIYRITHILFVAFIIVGTVLIIRQWCRKLERVLVSICLIMLFPLACNFIYVMAPDAHIYSLQKTQYFSLAILAMYIVIKSPNIQTKIIDKENLMKNLMICTMIAYCYIGFININEIYYKLQLNHNATFAYYTELVANLKHENAYDVDKAVYFIGDPDVSNELVDTEIVKEIDGYGWRFTNDDIVCRSSYGMIFCQNYLGMNIASMSQEDINTILDSNKFKEATVYPNNGFAFAYEDKVIVKMGEVKND